ncbi:Lipid droplet-associated hydrolase [Dillenia turbinata]|uniref:Lipid droplet-associated hydrolase n=1 Tax=Dillenia turbinata TaxID=194707 RepID=A0AAN8Z2B2_9MAGN
MMMHWYPPLAFYTSAYGKFWYWIVNMIPIQLNQLLGWSKEKYVYFSYTMSEMLRAFNLWKFLGAVKLIRVIHFVGHSIGAYITIEMFKRSPDKVIYCICLYPFLALNPESPWQSKIRKMAA